jgi:putative ABC transport system permease protein
VSIIVLSPWDLALAALLVLLLAGLAWLQHLALGRQLLVSALRTLVQLLLVGLVLKALFARATLGWLALMAAVMLLVAGWEVMRRQHLSFRGWWGYGLGAAAMFVSSFTLTAFALLAIVQPQPWYKPQYAIPLLGMMLGNTMNSIALAVDRLTQDADRGRAAIEARLLLGHGAKQALSRARREAVRTGMIPMMNAMAAAGVVSLPGMMTGQILAGNPPMVAVGYQILIMFMLVTGTGFGAMLAVELGSRRLFDERQRLRLDRLCGRGDQTP